MSLWLILIIIGVVLLLVGAFTTIGEILIWIGVAILVVSLIMTVISRGKSRV